MEPEPTTHASSALPGYWELIRTLVEEPRQGAREWVARILKAAGRSQRELERDLEAARAWRRLVESSAKVAELEVRAQVAEEGLGLLEEANAQARADAAKRISVAQRSNQALRQRLEAAQQAERSLLGQLDPDLRGRWQIAAVQLGEVRELLRTCRREGKNPEHLEACLETAEAKWQRVHGEARKSRRVR